MTTEKNANGRHHARGAAHYRIGAVVLGLVWYFGLSRARGTARVLTESDWWNFRLPPWMLLILLVTVSLGVALMFRKGIATSRTWIQHALLALALPVVGTILFTWGVVVVGLLFGRTGEANSLGEVFGFFVIIPFYGLLAVWYSLPTVLALGVVSQFVMHVLARRIGP